MRFSKIAIGVVLSVAAFSAHASNYIDIGFEENEIRISEDDGQNGNFYQTYMGFGFTPLATSPFQIIGSMSSLQADDPSNRDSWDRVRKQLYVAYKWQVGDLTFAPMAGVRHHTYSDGDRRDTEIRFFPNLNYKVSNSTDVYLGGYVSTIPTQNKDRSGATEDYKSYTDYKHELELGVKYKLSLNQYVKVGVFSEVDAFEDKAPDAYEGLNQLMLRLAYGGNITDSLFLEGIARFDIQRDKKFVGLDTRDEKRNRYGVNFSYTLDQDWKVHGMAYYQTEDNKAHDGNGNVIGADDTNDKIVYSLMIRRSF
ncbi:hypothetical protein [Photobacterium carnosum]|uniref:hypothetical protein n=1 Tax=Photobacterium carnosum TaxID=2023717 RepID=UPI001E6418DA|nr:hypothetical protein [Photobacterium carnosum]MCD9496596.1 hypothetical protein [Photobacterium carnosum]MCD9527831.1 hypothetical protein [Photobacterium carnosum]